MTRPPSLSPRLAAAVAALPLTPTTRVVEIGCGPGAAARAVVARVPAGHVLATDRSARAIESARRACAAELARGTLELRRAAACDLALEEGEAPYDVAFACRVGAFDGRHPELQQAALAGVRRVLAPTGRFFVDGRETPLERPDGPVPRPGGSVG